jgi:predicted enzyme related to lactoylglutathione lyase
MTRVVHFEIHCGDVDRGERFYTTVFGWRIQGYGGPMDYRLATTGPDGEPGINGALLQRQGEIDGQAVTAYVCTIQVDDLEQVEKRVPEAGGEQVMERTEIPEVGQLAYFKDTEGNIFGVLQPYGEGNVD